MWVRERNIVNGETVSGIWSDRVDFEVSTIGDLVDAFEDGVDDLLGLLDGI